MKYILVHELLTDEKDRAASLDLITCPVSPRCGSGIEYKGREGDELVFMFGDKRIVYKLKS